MAKNASRTMTLQQFFGWSCLGLAAFSGFKANAGEAGLSAGLDVTLEASASLQGGARSGEALHNLALAHLAWEQTESGAALHWRGYASALSLDGRGPTERFLGDFLAASNTEGAQSARLYAWWLEAAGAEWSLRAGALLADEEFAVTETGGIFFNSAFGWPAFISANTVNTGPAFFVAAPGLRLERRMGEAVAWRLGVYDGDTFDSPLGDPSVNAHGWHYRVGGSQGWFAIGEVACAPAASANRFKAGLWLHTASFSDVRDDAGGRIFAVSGAAPREHSANFGAYAIAERTLHGKAGEAGYTTAFVRLGGAPADRNTLSWVIDTGIARTGLLPGRPADVAALGVVHAAFSPRFPESARVLNPAAPKPDFEEVLEISYTTVLSPKISVIPDLQFIRHPGGSTAQRDAVAFLLRIKASY